MTFLPTYLHWSFTSLIFFPSVFSSYPKIQVIIRVIPSRILSLKRSDECGSLNAGTCLIYYFSIWQVMLFQDKLSWHKLPLRYAFILSKAFFNISSLPGYCSSNSQHGFCYNSNVKEVNIFHNNIKMISAFFIFQSLRRVQQSLAGVMQWVISQKTGYRKRYENPSVLCC